MVQSGNFSEIISCEPTAAESRCLHCVAFLKCLPPGARFCPRCGCDLRATHSPAPNPTRPWLGSPRFGSSAILAGYANALYTLGQRYESGGGLARNRNEAMRCYLKAARLGNLFAMARLPNAWLDHPQRPWAMPVVPPIPALPMQELDG